MTAQVTRDVHAHIGQHGPHLAQPQGIVARPSRMHPRLDEYAGAQFAGSQSVGRGSDGDA